ncbi:hypothetical protein Gohar_028080 [Gossypium harknessii]|uniref:CCHC-type domain-containing protein n=1 Tax=Gossypium harknessii TaxID=34285 RepID=A0A7J9ICP0_9ROSI|nr:hypothetical protein [Gossypium harknessii]
MEQFKGISLCETTKEAWTIPLNQHEGNVVLMLATIEEAKDIITLKLDELIDSIRSFEMNLIEDQWNKCYKCNGYGHIQSKCANTKKKQKSLVTTWSNKETDDDVSESDEELSKLKMMKKVIVVKTLLNIHIFTY